VNTSWFATLCELAELKPPNDLDAPSFAPLLLGKTTSPARMFWHFPHYTNQGGRPGGAVRDGDWKFIVHYDTAVPELYNLAGDISETRDLAAENPERAREMRGWLNAWIESVNAQTNAPNPDFNPALFRELYQDIDVTRHVPAQASSRAQAQLVKWRKQMNAVIPKPKK
jgi:arylsulfatase A